MDLVELGFGEGTLTLAVSGCTSATSRCLNLHNEKIKFLKHCLCSPCFPAPLSSIAPKG